MSEAKKPKKSADPSATSKSAKTAAGEEKGEERTTFFSLPKFKGAALMPSTSGKLLTALKSQISKLKVEQSGSGIRHQKEKYVVLPRTLRSAWMAKVSHPVLGDIRFLIGQTRSTWVILYDKPHEKLYEDPRFMGIELKRRDVTRTPKGKVMYISRIERSDLDKINAIAASDAREKTQPDTLAPTEGAFSLEETMAKLNQCTVGKSTSADFDPAAFFAIVRFITPTQGATGNYYYLDTGDPEAPVICELHVGKDPKLPSDVYGEKVTLHYKKEPCFLYIDVKY